MQLILCSVSSELLELSMDALVEAAGLALHDSISSADQ